MTADDGISLADVEAARERVADVTHETPLDPSTTLADLSGAAEVRLKLENMQRTGAFKARGAYNKLSRLSEADRQAGVVTISSGNHAQGVAYAARELGIDATVVMPTFAPAAKIDATRGYGANVVVHGDAYQALYDRAMELVERENRTFVHPFDDPDVIAGQGTIGLEIVDAFPAVDTVVVAVGGGGLISGVATAVKGLRPEARVVGVETTGSAHASRSLELDAVTPRERIDTIAEGIAAGRLGERTLAILRDRVDRLVTVDDDAVAGAMTLLTERANTVAEPAGATPIAALLEADLDVDGGNVALLVSGGNVNVTEHGKLTRVGLAHHGRLETVELALADWPSSLETLARTVEEHGAELEDVRQEPTVTAIPPNRRSVSVAISGTGPDHLEAVKNALNDCQGVFVVSS